MQQAIQEAATKRWVRTLGTILLAVLVGCLGGAMAWASLAAAAPAGDPSNSVQSGLVNCSATAWEPWQVGSTVYAQGGTSCGGGQTGDRKKLRVCLDIYGADQVTTYQVACSIAGPTTANPVRVTVGHVPTGVHRWMTAVWAGVGIDYAGECGIYNNTLVTDGSPNDEDCLYVATPNHQFTNH